MIVLYNMHHTRFSESKVCDHSISADHTPALACNVISTVTPNDVTSAEVKTISIVIITKSSTNHRGFLPFSLWDRHFSALVSVHNPTSSEGLPAFVHDFAGNITDLLLFRTLSHSPSTL